MAALVVTWVMMIFFVSILAPYITVSSFILRQPRSYAKIGSWTEARIEIDAYECYNTKCILFHYPRLLWKSSKSIRFMAVQEQQQQQHQQQLSEAERLRHEAYRIRLQAEQMDLNLTLQKINSLEEKLNNPTWIEKHPLQQEDLRNQLQQLNTKLNLHNSKGRAHESTNTVSVPAKEDSPHSTSTLSIADSGPQPQSSKTIQNNKHIPPKAGFSNDDLALYIPVANDINKMVPNATLKERIQLFQEAPELRNRFQVKNTNLIMGRPMETIQRLESLKSEYLNSNSSTERGYIKTQIDKLEESLLKSDTMEDRLQQLGETSFRVRSTALDGLGIGGHNNIIYCSPDILPPLTDDDLEDRFQTIRELPDILIAIYKQRVSVKYNPKALLNEGVTENLKLAIQLDYYDLQLRLLEQARAIDPFTEESRQDFKKAFEALPRPVQRHFARNVGVSESQSMHFTEELVLEKVRRRESLLSPLLQAKEAADSVSDFEYDDIEFIDRSRFLEELFPAIANMEGDHPDADDVDLFIADCLSKSKSFMVTSKPERVVGGYYIRGQNLLSNDSEQYRTPASERLVDSISTKLQCHPTLKDKLDFYYILDPSPPSDEMMEMGAEQYPILVVTTKDYSKLYHPSAPLTKAFVGFTGLLSVLIFASGCCVLNPSISDRLHIAIDANSDVRTSFPELLELCAQLYGSLLGIVLVHELAHRAVAALYKFEVGLPIIIPSITQGLAGAITPLKSPPPNNNALFDFAIAGPLAGFLASLTFMYFGLTSTQAMSMDTDFPVLPVDFVRCSSLGGSLVEYFLGKLSLLPDKGPDAVIQLHPYAIGGFIGLLINALALLPLGHTDGGRISLAMFGRRGAFVTKLFTTLMLTLAGFYGLDDNNILLVYVLYTLIWQRELETPIRNEVEEIDVFRGLVGIVGALLVGLVLIPMG